MDHQQVLQRGPVTSSRAHATQRQAEEKTVRWGRREGERAVREEMRGLGREERRRGGREDGEMGMKKKGRELKTQKEIYVCATYDSK